MCAALNLCGSGPGDRPPRTSRRLRRTWRRRLCRGRRPSRRSPAAPAGCARQTPPGQPLTHPDQTQSRSTAVGWGVGRRTSLSPPPKMRAALAPSPLSGSSGNCACIASSASRCEEPAADGSQRTARTPKFQGVHIRRGGRSGHGLRGAAGGWAGQRRRAAPLGGVSGPVARVTTAPAVVHCTLAATRPAATSARDARRTV